MKLFKAYQIHTQIEIEAPAEKVWNVLTDFTGYKKWNLFIPSVSGQLVQGALLDILITVPNSKSQKYKVKILQLQENKMLRWLGHFKLPGLVDGDHIFEIQALANNRTLFIQRERFNGVLVPFLWNFYINSKLRSGFIVLNEGLKNYLESN